ncbi:hypothetical protein C0J52_23874 [Blattella germanica]|nr:hypothetical protein C0J52_23874 [Blattella germanica]
MNQCVVIVGFITIFFGLCVGLPHSAAQISNFKFSIWSYRNKTGQWMAKVLMAHDVNDKDSDPIAVTVDHEAKKFEDHEEIVINVTALARPNITTDLEHAILKEPTILPCTGYKQIEASGIDGLISESIFANHWFWIGFHDQDVEGRYVTVLNKPLAAAGYLKWAEGEPLSGSKYNCGFYRRNNGLGTGSCSFFTNGNPFICELSV